MSTPVESPAPPRVARCDRRRTPALAAALAAAAGVALVSAFGTGCASTSPTAGLGQAITAYDAGRYETAREQAIEAADAGNGRVREQASYVAGLCAYRLGDLDEAERRLAVATRSGDAETAGSATATLGLVRLAQDRPRDAATMFASAADALDGPAAREAALHAAEAWDRAGDDDSARTWRVIAGDHPAPGVPSIGGAIPSSTATFALQIGAFSERQRAEAAAEHASREAGSAGLGNPRIVRRPEPRGASLYVVQLGRFRSRSEAADARSRLGRLEYIVAPTVLATR